MEKEIIRTIPEKCVLCYACVRNCPVKAVAIKDGKAQIIQERCIQCGNCVKICPQKAKEVLSGIKNTLNYLENGNTVALIAPSFPAAFPGRVHKIAAALKEVGFDYVWEVAVGAELVARECRNLELGNHPNISSSCPGVINLIEKHYSQFIPFLIPIVSPAVATARIIRYLYPDNKYKIVFIGPCIAKKGEIRQPSVVGEIHEAITFHELEEIFSLKNIDWDNLKDTEFDSPAVSLACTFPLSGGLLRNMNQTNDLLRDDCLVIDGFKNWWDVMEIVGNKNASIRLVDGLICSGCIDGPAMNGKNNILERKTALLRYVRSIPLQKQELGKKELSDIKVNLKRTYEDLKVTLPQPTEKDIIDILKQTKKEKKEDQLNCGACGYPSCREKAIAVYQGIAEQEICLPYLLAQKNELIQSIDTELKRERTLKEEMNILIDSSYDGICMTDGDGNIQRVNETMVKLVGIEKESLLGKNANILEQNKVLYPSATMMVLRAKKAVTFLQQLKSGKRVLATGNPVFDEQDNITRVICNIRDFDILQKIKEELDNVYHIQKVEKLDTANQIITLSDAFNNVLSMALRVAIVDSTVLLLGESGVGKEVVARYIHKNSKRSKGPFIKINCGALPESLIESELFGYETGAFTGAKKAGKQGLFEMAHGGTIFLDEIGELPLSQQVKLLQVIQEKQITRIGGTQHKKVDIRLLAATNRDLTSMVKEGNFRADLFYRLNVVPITIPPLTERRNDIIPLMYYFLERFNQRYNKKCKVSKEVKEIFLNYDWPGNVRELENIMERLVVIASGQTISKEELPPALYKNEEGMQQFRVQGILPLKKAQEEVEKYLIFHARELYGSTYKIAEVLGVNQSTIVRKLKKYMNDAEGNY